MAVLSKPQLTTTVDRSALRRPMGEHSTEAQPIELFFDLVYVLAVTQLTHHLVTHLSARGALQTLSLLIAVWAAWINTIWVTNYFDVGARPVRLALLGLMFASLIMSAFLPDAYSGRGFTVALAFVTIVCAGSGLAAIAFGPDDHLRAPLERVLIWWVGLSLIWLAGGLVDGNGRLAIWLVAGGLMLVVIWFGFPVPGLGRSQTTDYTIAGAHLAERCSLFIIIALGESILVTGAGFGDLPSTTNTVVAFVVAFVGSAALWWIYFDRAEEAALEKIAESDDPGRLGVIAYTYCHIPMVAGIIVAAAADELTIAHPGEDATATTAALILGGPALYLIGNALFKRAIWEYVPRTRLIAIGALVALIPVTAVSSRLGLATAAAAILVGLAAQDLRTHRRMVREGLLPELLGLRR
jgi:low temperature requirement protein LtrA